MSAIHVFAAGSLRAAFEDLAEAAARRFGFEVALRFGASGLLREAIEAGAEADLFASADMGHPTALTPKRANGPVVCFARNRICALARPELDLSSHTLLERLLDPAVAVGVSTPGADPSGDYAVKLFERAEHLSPGAFERLDDKARRLTGGRDTPRPAAGLAGESVYGALLAEGAADLFLTYRTNAELARRERPELTVVEPPDALAVGAEYGLVLLDRAPVPAWRFALFLLSFEGREILEGYFFHPPG